MKPRPIKIDGEVAYITLTKGHVAVIDAADVPLVDGWNWHSIDYKKSMTVYASRTVWIGGGRFRIFMHREILDAPTNMQVDHIDGDGLNNMRENLRLATSSQNCHNHRISLRNTSGFKGVSRHKKSDKWRAYIRFQGRQIWLGLFDTPEEAAAAYAAASEKFHGEFGRLE